MPVTDGYGWTMPTVGGSSGTWGTELNTLVDDEIEEQMEAVEATADAAMPKAGGSFGGEIDILTERYITNNKGSLSGAVTIDTDIAQVVLFTVTGNITSMSITGLPAAPDAAWVTFEITNGGAFSITWDTAIVWDGGSPPTLLSSGVDLVVFYTRDGGTTIRGMHAGSFSS